MNNSGYIDLQGRHFKSKLQMCQANNISYKAFCNYISNHQCSYTEALHYYLDNLKEDFVDLQGRHFKTIVQMCEANNINYGKFYSYTSTHQCSYIEALHFYLDNTKEDFIDLQGRHFKTIKQMCQANDINYDTFNSYIRNHQCSYTEALHFYLDPGDYIDLQGRHFKSIRQMSHANGINCRTFNSYIWNYKCSYTEALHYYLDPKEDFIDLQGRHFKSIRQMCQANGIKYDTFIAYTKNHKCRYTEALHYYLDNPKDFIDLQGRHFKSMIQMCQANEINYDAFVSYTKNHKCSCTEALHFYLDPGDYIDLQDRHFKTMLQMCEVNGINYIAFLRYIDKYNCSYKEALLHPFLNTQYTKSIFINKQLSNKLYLCLVNGFEQILPYSFLKKQKLSEAKEAKNE